MPTDERLPPVLSGGLPFLGHAYHFWSDPVGLMTRGQRELGHIWSLMLAGQRATVLTGPEGNGAFFRASDQVLSPRECYQFTVPVFGPGVGFDVPLSEFDRQLSFVHPALAEKRLRTYVAVMVEEAEQYLATWGNAGERDVYEVSQDIIFFFATRTLLGPEIRRRFNTEFARLYKHLAGGMTMLAYFAPHAPLPAFRRRDRARAAVLELLRRIMTERKQADTESDDFLGTLMAYRDENGAPLSDQVIVGLLLTLIFAGHEESAALAAWTGILLHQHPEFLALVVDEQRQELGNQRITYESLKRLVLLEQAIKEALRLHPPLIVLMRTVLRPLRVNGYELPAGSLAMSSPAVSHRLPELYTNPDTYDPMRFAAGREDRRAPYSLIGFGGGKHRCLGMVLAYQQVKVMWSMVLQQYEIELVERDYRPDYRTLVVGPRQPCRIGYRRRQA
jgi:sterol 14-demethylase